MPMHLHFVIGIHVLQGLTEKFKEKDTSIRVSNFRYESFMLTVLPFLIA